MNVRMTTRAVAALLAMTVLNACGGAQMAAPTASSAALGMALPDAAALKDADDADTSSAVEALRVSYVLQALGDFDGAVDVLLDSDGFDTPLLATMRLQRIYDLDADLPDVTDRMADILDEPPPAHPWGRLMHAELAHSRANTEYRRSLTPGLLDSTPWGAAVTWRLAGPFSSADVIDADTVFEPEGDEQIADRYELGGGTVTSRLVRTYAGRANLMLSGDGVYYVESFLTVDRDTEALVVAGSGQRYTLLIDGVEVLTRSVADTYASQTRMTRVWLPQGHHRVLIRLSAGGRVAPFFLRVLTDEPGALTAFAAERPGDVAGGVRAADPAGVAPITLFSGLDSAPDTVDWLVRADVIARSADALAAADALGTLANAPRHPLRALATAGLTDVAYTWRPSDRSSLALDHLGTAHAAWPEAAAIAVELGERYLDEGQLDAAEDVIDDAAMRRPDVAAVQLALADLARQQGWDALWRQANRNVVATWPGHCGAISDAVADQLERTGVLTPETLPEGWRACDGVVEDLAVSFHLARGDTDAALALMSDLVSRSPDNGHARELLIDLLVGMGDTERAQALLDEGARWGMSGVDRRAIEVDLALVDDASTDDAVGALLDTAPTLPGAHELAAFFDGEPMFARLRLDGLAAVREFEASGASYGGAIVYVLDYAVQAYEQDGSGVEIVHQVTRLQSRDALGSYGEVGIPGDATLLTVRTIKRDGRTLVPEDIAGKDSISMPNLEIGDYIELEYVRPIEASDARVPIARSWRFYFGTLDGAMHRTIARYDIPEAWRDDATFDVRAFTGTREEASDAGRWTVTFTMEAVPPVLPEPRAPNADEWMPSVRFGHALSWDRVAQRYAERAATVTVVTPELRRAAEEITRGASGVRERTHRIFRAVNDDIIDFGGFFSDPAVWTWSTGEGERLALAYALLDAAGLEPELAFVRPAEQDQVDTDVVDDAVYDLTALVVRDGRDDIWMEPEFDEYPFDYLRAEAQGMRAFFATGPRAGTFVTTPSWPRADERTEVRLEVAFDTDGDATVRGNESFPLRTAGSVRMLVQTIDDPGQLERQLESGLVSTFGRVELHEYAFIGLEDADAPLQMTYDFDAAGLARSAGDALVWDGAIYERPLYSAYGSQDARTLPLAIVLPMFERMEIEFVAPQGWTFEGLPASQSLGWGDSRVERTWELVAPDRVRLTRVIELPIQRVAPEAYEGFAEFLRDAQAGERSELTMQPR